MERLQKLISQAGAASRREAERLILAGRVTINGRVAALGEQAGVGDEVAIDGVSLKGAASKVYFLLNKPKGYLSTVKDDRGRKTVLDLLNDVDKYVYPVGRLDYNTEGLLLLTNDGQLMNGLLHPSRQVKKTYVAKVSGVPTSAELRRLRQGLELEDGMTAPAEVRLRDQGIRETKDGKKVSYAVVELTIHEGRNRQVRRMLAAVGHKVLALERVAFAGLTLAGVKRGKYRYLTQGEVAKLKGYMQA